MMLVGNVESEEKKWSGWN